MLALAEEPMSDALRQALTIGGPICAFIVIFVIAAILLYTKIVAPELKATRESREKEQAGTMQIAADFAVATQQMEQSVARLDSMHERCHQRERDARKDRLRLRECDECRGEEDGA